jgi:hypothetical protein
VSSADKKAERKIIHRLRRLAQIKIDYKMAEKFLITASTSFK